jgi:hypothetical protein
MVLRELVGEEGEYGEETVTTVTIVITDIDDELPVFSRDKVAVPVPEDIGKILITIFLRTVCQITTQF